MATAAERLQGKLVWQPANPNLGDVPDGRNDPVMKLLGFGSARRLQPDRAPSRSTVNEVRRGDIVVWGAGFHWALATGRQRGGSPEVMSLYNIPKVTVRPENQWTDRYPSMHVQRTSIATLDRGIRAASLRHARRWKIPLSQVRRQQVRIIDSAIWSKLGALRSDHR